MKIALSTTVIQRGRSGVGHYVEALVRALLPAAQHHDFTLFVLEEDRPLFSFADGIMSVVGVDERFRPPAAGIFWHQAVLPGLARRAGIDVLHVPSYRRMLWRRPCTLVATIHDLAPFRFPGKYDPLRMFYGRVVARALAHRQDHIIAVSHSTGADLRRHFRVPPGRITVVPNGIDHHRFRPGAQIEARRKLAATGVGDGAFFLYVARFEHPGKNHVRLIEAFDRFKMATRSNWKLVLAGSDWHGAEVIHSRIRASPFTRDIQAPGFVPAAALPDWYRAADVFIFPSLFEGFGLPPIEAMACGCPVLSSLRGALAETVGEAAGALDPEDVVQMESQMARAVADDAWRGQLRSAGLARAKQFAWEKAAEDTLQVYQRARRQAGLPSPRRRASWQQPAPAGADGDGGDRP